MDWQSLIQSTPFLESIPVALRKKTELRTVAAGEMLFRIGDPVRNLFYVLGGEVSLVRHDTCAAHIVLQRSRGGFVAEASISSKTYHCDAEVCSHGDLLCFPLESFQAVLEGDAPFRTMWMTLLAREVRALRTKCERLSLHGAADRIVHYLESEGDGGAIVLNQSRKAWATELGLSHEVLYRTLKRLADQGILHIDGAQVSLVRAL